MTAVLDRVSEIQDQVIEAITNVNKPITDAVSSAVSFVVDNVPQIPAVPFADQLPTPKELINNQARFASKLVTTNKTVALSIAGAAQPLTDPLLGRKTAASKAKAA
ncbi:MAG: hypothetical protein KDB26_06330 [Microthrixaceae bacterium]|nr:hypothetical protein [Microthrixaceae bacterium]